VSTSPERPRIRGDQPAQAFGIEAVFAAQVDQHFGLVHAVLAVVVGELDVAHDAAIGVLPLCRAQMHVHHDRGTRTPSASITSQSCADAFSRWSGALQPDYQALSARTTGHVPINCRTPGGSKIPGRAPTWCLVPVEARVVRRRGGRHTSRKALRWRGLGTAGVADGACGAHGLGGGDRCRLWVAEQGGVGGAARGACSPRRSGECRGGYRRVRWSRSSGRWWA